MTDNPKIDAARAFYEYNKVQTFAAGSAVIQALTHLENVLAYADDLRERYYLVAHVPCPHVAELADLRAQLEAAQAERERMREALELVRNEISTVELINRTPVEQRISNAVEQALAPRPR